MQNRHMQISEAISALDKVARSDEPETKRQAQSIAGKASAAVESLREFHEGIKEKFDELRDAFNELETLVDELEGQVDRIDEAGTALADAGKDEREGAHAELVEGADELHYALLTINGDDPPHLRLAEAVKELNELLAP